MKIKKINNPTNDQSIKRFEEKIGVNLPKDYRKFLLQYNGGKPELYIFPETEKVYSLALDEFNGIDTGKDYSDLFWNLDTYNGRISNNFIPIADTINGDQFVLGIKGKFKDKIYLWDHNTELEYTEFTENELPGNMYELADSFTEFINALKEDKEA